MNHLIFVSIIRPRRSRSAAVYSHRTFPWMFCRSVHLCLLRLVHCGKTADRIRMPFGVIGRTGPLMRQVVGFGDRSTGRCTFGGRIWGTPLSTGTYRTYVCYSTVTRPSCHITMDRLVCIYYEFPCVTVNCNRQFHHNDRCWFQDKDRRCWRWKSQTTDMGHCWPGTVSNYHINVCKQIRLIHIQLLFFSLSFPACPRN